MSRWRVETENTPLGPVTRVFRDGVEIPGVYRVELNDRVNELRELRLTFLVAGVEVDTK